MVVDGTPQTISYKVAGRAATARWKKANTFIGGTGTLAALHDDQPAKFAAVEGRWTDEQPAAEVIFAIPDAA
ncbi:cytochrome ubiquinol oxidase subunit I, partial [Serratia marcescens]|uniref:cytochrome ubiquinol oxidase subunit I n=1 Tax=Serratia marcescens TaxID=615 RepID=UPI000A4B6EB6